MLWRLTSRILEDDPHGGGCHLAGHELNHAVLEQRKFQEVVAVVTLLSAQLAPSRVRVEEAQRGGLGHVEINRTEDVALHLEELALLLYVLADHHEVLDGGRVDFLVLAGDPEAGGPQQLQVDLRDLVALHVAVEEVDRQEQRLAEQVEALVDVQHPVDHHAAHL